MDEVVVANSDAIHQLKSETLKLIAAKEPIEDGNVLIEVIEMQNVMEKTTSKNADNVKLLDEEIKCMLKEINDKNVSKKEIDDAIKRLDEEISDIKNERKERKATVEEIIVGDKTKVLKKRRFFNTGYIVNINKSVDSLIQKRTARILIVKAKNAPIDILRDVSGWKEQVVAEENISVTIHMIL